MKLLEQYISEKGKIIGNDILKVDSFLNHQIDVDLLYKIGAEFKRLFCDCNINKIVTIEASGIAVACLTALHFSVPVVYAKKNNPRNIGSNVYSGEVFSFTKNTAVKVSVSKDYINNSDRILIIDDFLANGQAAQCLIDIIENQAKATVAGIGIVIEKGFQDGGKKLRAGGKRLESLAIISSIDNGIITFG